MADRSSSLRPRVNAAALGAIMLLLFALQIALYSESFQVEPAGDDFSAPLADFWRGEREGPIALLVRSLQPHNYRPLQSLAIWATCSISAEHRLFFIHALQFAGMAAFALAAWLWLRRAPVSTFAASCGAAAMFAHPALVASLGGIDGYSSVASTGFAWIAAYLVWAFRDRLPIALLTAVPVFLLGMGFKEYALAAVPLACFAVLCFSDSLRIAIIRAFVVGVVFSIVVIAIIVVRKYTIPPPRPGQEIGYFTPDLIAWARNAALFTGVLLFPGSTSWMFLNRTIITMAITGASIALTGITLLVGMLRAWRVSTAHLSTTVERPGAPDDVRRWIVFSMLGVAGGSFPAVLIAHVSEMYSAGMVLPIALLVALAMSGFAHMRVGWRAAGTIILIGSLLWAVISVRSKVTEMREQGERARLMLEQILALLPADSHDAPIAVCYRPQDYPQPRYSVYKYPDDLLIDQPYALWWLRPHSGLIEAAPAPTVEEALSRADKYALIVQWNAAEDRMEVVRSNPALSRP